MIFEINQVKQERAKLIADMRKVVDKAETEKRNLSAEEQTNWDAMFAKAEELRARAERMETQMKLDSQVSDLVTPIENRGAEPTKADKVNAAFRNYLMHGKGRALDEYRALSTTDANGGYTVPESWSNQVAKDINNFTFARQLASTMLIPSGDTFNYPLFSSLDAATRVAENAAATADSSTPFSTRQFVPTALAATVGITRKLLRTSAVNIEALVSENMAYQIAIKLESEFMVGTGSSQMLGIFTASANGINTDRDVTNGISYLGLVDTKYHVKAQYWPNASWIMSRTVMKHVQKLRDSTGRPLWSESLIAGQPDRILGNPVYVSEYAPASVVDGAYTLAFGDWKNAYLIVDAYAGMQLEVDPSPSTDSNIFYLRVENDGRPLRTEGCARLVHEASV